MLIKYIRWICLAVCLLSAAIAQGATNKIENPHDTPSGFFDMHVCHWPNQPPFYLTLYSTPKFNDVASVKVYDPNGVFLGSLDLSRYRILKQKNKPLKHVFITHIPFSHGAPDGWYSASIRLKDGTLYHAKDRVIHIVLSRSKTVWPKNHAELSSVPLVLKWTKVSGAAFYKVFIRDSWNSDKEIYDSKLVRTNHLKLPKGLLKPGGLYTWRVHARDVNNSIELGDFNAGSLGDWSEFSVSDN